MDSDWKRYRLIDDPLCDLDETIPHCLDCRECEYFYDCMEEDDDEDDEDINSRKEVIQ